MEQRVTGIGGIFFRANDPEALRAWYRTHLGVPIEQWGGAMFSWKTPPGTEAGTVWNIFDKDTDYFGPEPKSFMVNFRVADLHGLVAALRAEGCNVDDNVQDSEYGKFGWVTDPEGNRIELWEPPPGQ